MATRFAQQNKPTNSNQTKTQQQQNVPDEERVIIIKNNFRNRKRTDSTYMNYIYICTSDSQSLLPYWDLNFDSIGSSEKWSKLSEDENWRKHYFLKLSMLLITLVLTICFDSYYNNCFSFCYLCYECTSLILPPCKHN